MSDVIVIPTLEGVPLTNITDPADEDVLCGRGGASQRHTGNQMYRMLVNLNKGIYITSLKTEKLRLSRSIVAAIRQRRGRFLERDGDDGKWYDIGDKKAVEKTSQALREGQPKLRQTMIECSDPETWNVAGMPLPTGRLSLPLSAAPRPQHAAPMQSHSSITMINPVTNQHTAFINQNGLPMNHSSAQRNHPFMNLAHPQHPQQQQLLLQLQHPHQHGELQLLQLQQRQQQQQQIASQHMHQATLAAVPSESLQSDVNLMNMQLQNDLMELQRLSLRPTGSAAPYQSQCDIGLVNMLHQHQQLHQHQEQRLQQQEREHQQQHQNQQRHHQLNREDQMVTVDDSLGHSELNQIDLFPGTDELSSIDEERQQNQYQSKKQMQNQSGSTPFSSSSLPPLPGPQRSQMSNLGTLFYHAMSPFMSQTTKASKTPPSASDTATSVAVPSTSNGAARKVDRRRLFAKMKVSRPGSGRFESSSISNPSLGAERSLGTEGTPSDLYNTMLDSQFSLTSNLSAGNGTKQDGSSLSKRMTMESAGRPGSMFRDPVTNVSDNHKREDYIMALESRRSLMSGLSKISDSSDVQSMFSDLSKKIGNVSTQSIAMSEISGIEEEYQGDALTVGSKATMGSFMEEDEMV